MQVVAVGLLLLLCSACGGNEDGGEEFRVYHLEAAIGPPADDGELRCGPPRPVCPGVVEQPPPRTFRYAIRQEPALTSDEILRDTASVTVGPAVTVDLTEEGRAAFAQVTREAARLGGRDQAWHHVAIVVGDEIVAFPQIDYDEYPDGFTNAASIQLAAAGDADARDLVRRLRGE
jgi:preprotein translocase subunit SecD